MGRLRLHMLRPCLRYAFHAAAAFSALALVACLILWPRSYYRVDEGLYQGPARCVTVVSWCGRLRLLGHPASFPHRSFALNSRPPGPFSAPDWSYATWHATGFVRLGSDICEIHEYLGLSVLPDPKGQALLVPFSYLTLLSALPPALWLRAWRRRAQRARGFPVEPPSPSETRPSGSVAADSPPPAR